MHVIRDQYGRTFRTLRVSLLDHCNLGCVYCVAPGATDHAATTKGLSVSALLAMIGRLHGQLQLHTIRLTGGEPLLYAGLAELIKEIKAMGIEDIKLTTNGFLLQRQAPALKNAGLGAINVSLDAIDEAIFHRMSRRHGVERIISGIDATLATGMDVKINTVVMKGMNDTQILPLLEFAFSRNIRIRFLEVMAMGHLHDQSDKYLFSQQDMLSAIAARYELTPLGRQHSATASYWRTDSGHVFGIIANESQPFCRDCDRLRLDSKGNIYGCLSSDHPIPLEMQEDDAIWQEKLQTALLQKQALRFTGSSLSMLHIGG